MVRRWSAQLHALAITFVAAWFSGDNVLTVEILSWPGLYPGRFFACLLAAKPEAIKGASGPRPSRGQLAHDRPLYALGDAA